MAKKFNTSLAFVDILFNVVLGFFYLLMLAVILINPKKKTESEAETKIKSDILISIEWPKGYLSDVDLLLKVPNGQIVYYSKKQIAGASLDRDDLGARSDAVRMPDGTTKIIDENWENIRIDKLMPGWYTVNILMYQSLDSKPVPVKSKVQKFRPYQLILYQTSNLAQTGDEITLISFEVDNKGNIIKTNDNYVSLIRRVGR